MRRQHCHEQAPGERQAWQYGLRPASEEEHSRSKQPELRRGRVQAWAMFGYSVSLDAQLQISLPDQRRNRSYLVDHADDETLLLNLVGLDCVLVLQNLAYNQRQSEPSLVWRGRHRGDLPE